MLPMFSRNSARSLPNLARGTKSSAPQFSLSTCAERPDLFEASVALENETWDRLSFLDYTNAHHAHYDALLERFPDYRLCMVEIETGELVATGMCVPLSVADDSALPQEGWDWIVDTAIAQDGQHSNVIGALSISVPAQHRHRGFARDMINTMRALANIRKCWGVIAPVRPSAKSSHPFVSMHDYVGWTDSSGRIFDPWLRSHVAVGGTIMGVCDRSMVVEQPLEFWQSWTDGALDADGSVLVEGALAPLSVNAATGTGSYVEPNVWVTHRL
jgi:hypothetical protein